MMSNNKATLPVCLKFCWITVTFVLLGEGCSLHHLAVHDIITVLFSNLKFDF